MSEDHEDGTAVRPGTEGGPKVSVRHLFTVGDVNSASDGHRLDDTPAQPTHP